MRLSLASALIVLCAVAVATSGCGKKGRPLPPEPRGPLRPLDVSARQVGARVVVEFVVPRPRGAHPNQTPVRVELVRVDYGAGVEPPADPGAFRRRGTLAAIYEAAPLPGGERLAVEDRTLADVENGGIGRTLRYGVRVLDRRARPSALVVAPDLTPLPFGPPPVGLVGEATAAGVELAWGAPAGEGPWQYNVYRRAPDASPARRPLNAQPLTVPRYVDSTVELGERYRYEVRVVLAPDAPFREGPPSEPRTVLAADRFPPDPPDGLVAVFEGEGIRLFWNPGAARDLAGYRVYRRVGDGAWERIEEGPLTAPSFLDRDVETPGIRRYRVTAIDATDPPNESEPSAVEAIDLRPDGSGTDG